MATFVLKSGQLPTQKWAEGVFQSVKVAQNPLLPGQWPEISTKSGHKIAKRRAHDQSPKYQFDRAMGLSPMGATTGLGCAYRTRGLTMTSLH